MNDQPFELNCDTFGDFVRQIKEEHGFTIEGLAMKTGLSPYAISSYISRHKPPSLYSVERIVHAFGMKIEIR